jgi:4-alpha-glucanotransferase
MQFAKVLRIDHIPSFHRVFWIPPGGDANDGVYVRYPAEELYGIFALESHRHKTMLVGEDLGTVPPEVPQAMARHNFHRMYVVQYELKPDRGAALPHPPATSVASINTHDMPPFAGFWQGDDLRERERAGLLSADGADKGAQERKTLRDTLQEFLQSIGYIDRPNDAGDALLACLAFLRDSPARMVLINLEDLCLETRSQNIPSTGEAQQNWSRKMRLSWEEFSQDSNVLRMLQCMTAAFATKQGPENG